MASYILYLDGDKFCFHLYEILEKANLTFSGEKYNGHLQCDIVGVDFCKEFGGFGG